VAPNPRRLVAASKCVLQRPQLPAAKLVYRSSRSSAPEMEMDLYLPSFRTMRKRSRSRSPTPCEHDRPLVRSSVLCSLFCLNLFLLQKRLSVPAFAVGDGVREPPPSFTPPHSTSPLSSVQVQTPSAILPVPGSAQSAYIRAADADGTIQDEWVDLTRNLTLLSARGSTELDIDISGSREETMMVGISNTTALSSRLHSSELMASRYSVTCHTESR
jgi:hypothetical protein